METSQQQQQEVRHARVYPLFFKELHRLSRGDIAVYLVIRLHTDRDGLCYLKTSTIAKIAGISDRHARRVCKKLQKNGLIRAMIRNGHAWYIQT